MRREEEDAERIGMVSVFGFGGSGGVFMGEVCFRRGRLRIVEGRPQRCVPFSLGLHVCSRMLQRSKHSDESVEIVDVRMPCCTKNITLKAFTGRSPLPHKP